MRRMSCARTIAHNLTDKEDRHFESKRAFSHHYECLALFHLVTMGRSYRLLSTCMLFLVHRNFRWFLANHTTTLLTLGQTYKTTHRGMNYRY
jgi:hypothetical protein